MGCYQSNTINIQGHRGCRGLMPENTLEGFLHAIDIGVNTLEMDVVVSQDSFVVVSHEPYMNSEICLDFSGNTFSESEEKKFNLYQMEFDSIKRFDCGSKYHPRFPEQAKFKTYKPSLQEVLRVTQKKNPNIKFNIEIKSSEEGYNIYTPLPKPFVAMVLAVLKSNNALSNTNLQSFNLEVLEEIKKQAPRIQVALLVDENETIEDKLKKLSYKPEIISPYYKLLNPTLIAELKKEDYKVIPWTVNEIEELKLMLDLEVDGIITDYPDRLIKLLN